MTMADRVGDLLRDLAVKIDLDAEARGNALHEISEYVQKDLRERAFVTLIAVDLDRYYTAVESTFEAIARGLDGSVPESPDWHRVLLAQMSKPCSTRPSVIREPTRAALEEFRRFRHFLRHAYAVELDWHKLEPLVTALPGVESMLVADIAAFRTFLDACIEENGG